jgi:hypothetical protein
MKLDWKHFKLKTNNYVLNAYIQEDDIDKFWKLWNLEKEKIKKNGFSVKKYNKKWQLTYWNKNPSSNIEIIKFICIELCKELGFIVNKENSCLKDKLIFLPNEILHIILSYLTYYELNIIKDTILFNKSILNYNDFHKIIVYKIFDILNIFQNKIKKICFSNINDFYKKTKELIYSYDEKKDYIIISINNNEFIEYFYFYRYRHINLNLQHKILYPNRITCKNTDYKIPDYEIKHIYNNWCDLCYFIKILNDTNYDIISILFDSESHDIHNIVRKYD